MSIAISGQDVPSNAWIVFTDKEKIEETVHYFSKYSRGLKSMCNYFAYNIFDKAIHYLINTLGAVFLGTFSLGVWVTIHHLIYTDLVASEKELGLLKALGYSVRYIRQRVLKFFSVGLMAGALLGIGIGEVLIILFAYLYCYEEGITYVLWHFSFLVIPLIVLLGLYLIIFISITNYIKNIESIKTN